MREAIDQNTLKALVSAQALRECRMSDTRGMVAPRASRGLMAACAQRQEAGASVAVAGGGRAVL